MVYYASSKKLPNGHYMTRPEGVSEEFYNIAQKDMNENLFTGDRGWKNIMRMKIYLQEIADWKILW